MAQCQDGRLCKVLHQSSQQILQIMQRKQINMSSAKFSMGHALISKALPIMSYSSANYILFYIQKGTFKWCQEA